MNTTGRSGAGATDLVLFPTERERELFGAFPSGDGSPFVALCGFGPVAAAAVAARRLAESRPRSVLLVGIAGTYDEARLPIGAAAEFSAVELDGVGAGDDRELVGPRALGLPQWAGSPAEIYERLELAPGAGAEPTEILTVAAASASREQAALRRARHPQALAEDMEGFGVALACALAGVPCRIVRGISNAVGDRERARWKVREAMDAARAIVARALGAA